MLSAIGALTVLGLLVTECVGVEEPAPALEILPDQQRPAAMAVGEAAPAARGSDVRIPEPCSKDWFSDNPCELTAEERQELRKFTDEIVAAETPLSRYELRNRSAELILVESPRVADGYWQALITIQNKSKNMIPSSAFVRCVLSDPLGTRLALSTPVAASEDLGPGETFTDQALAEVPDGARVAKHECKFEQ